MSIPPVINAAPLTVQARTKTIRVIDALERATVNWSRERLTSAGEV